MNFSVCPHDTQNELVFWKDFAKQFEIKFGEKINFEPFYSFEEEDEKLSSKTYHLYYARPAKIVYLYQKGYKPVAKFKGQNDQLFFIGKNPDVIKKDYIKIAVPLETPAYGVIDFEVKHAEVVFTNNFNEVYEYVLNCKTDVGIMYNEIWDKIEDKKDVKIIKKTFFEAMHIFMAHISVYDKVKSVLLSFDFLEEVSDKDIFQVISISDRFKFLARKWEEHDIATAIFDLNNVGVVIYQEKLVYANEFTYKLFGYSEKEALSKTILDFVYEDDRQKLLTFIEKRLKGQKIANFYYGIRGVDKYGKIHILSVFSSTILYKGKNSGFFIFFDITTHIKIERLYHLLREVNLAITKSTLEEEMYEKICEGLVKKAGIKFISIVTKDGEEAPYFKVLHKYGADQGYLNEVKISWREDLPTGRCPTGTAFRTGKIDLISNTQTDQRFIPWKELAKKVGFLSVAAIPLKDENGNIKNVITMYSSEPEFFDEEVLSILNEIKYDLEFAIKRFYEIRQSILIQEALEKAPSWVVITDEESNIVYLNENVCRISGSSKKELIGKNPRIFKSGIHPKSFYENLYKTITSGNPFSSIFVNKKKNRELFYNEQTIFPIVIEPNIRRYMSIGKEITREVKMQDEIIKIKESDLLTGLYNLNSFLSVVSSQLSTISERQYSVMVHIDIYHFKHINQVYGLEIGNHVLKVVSNRLQSYFPGAIISRISGDEFGIYKGNFYSDNEIENFIDGLKSLFNESISIGKDIIELSFHAGISVAPKDGNKFNEIYEKASIALRYSRKQRENTILFYDTNLGKKINQYLNTLKLIERALKEDLFVLYYQPFFNTQTLKIEGFEALVRIKDKDGTFYSPYVFIDILEESKFLLDFEKWLVNKIHRQIKKWNKVISFNISLNDFTNEAFIEYLLDFDFGNMAIMELTERIFAQNLEKVKATLIRIKEKNKLKIAIDDFGTEYSSLRYIKDLPIDELKIDISFVKTIIEDYRNKILVETIILLSKRLGFMTLAEGVETEEHLKILQEMNCDYVQSYLLGKPKTEEEVEKLLEKER